MKKEKKDMDEVEFVEELPRSGNRAGWTNQLLPLLKRPGVWARIWVFETPDQAYSLQSNLHQRLVKIPEPEHVWEFAARGCEVYAIYRGRKRGSSASVRRANRRG